MVGIEIDYDRMLLYFGLLVLLVSELFLCERGVDQEESGGLRFSSSEVSASHRLLSELFLTPLRV